MRYGKKTVVKRTQGKNLYIDRINNLAYSITKKERDLAGGDWLRGRDLLKKRKTLHLGDGVRVQKFVLRLCHYCGYSMADFLQGRLKLDSIYRVEGLIDYGHPQFKSNHIKHGRDLGKIIKLGLWRRGSLRYITQVPEVALKVVRRNWDPKSKFRKKEINRDFRPVGISGDYEVVFTPTHPAPPDLSSG